MDPGRFGERQDRPGFCLGNVSDGLARANSRCDRGVTTARRGQLWLDFVPIALNRGIVDAEWALAGGLALCDRNAHNG